VSEAEAQIEAVAPASRASEELYLGDAIHFFLSAKRAGGRSERTLDDYRKYHLAALRSFFQTLSRRLEVADPSRTLDEVRSHSAAPQAPSRPVGTGIAPMIRTELTKQRRGSPGSWSAVSRSGHQNLVLARSVKGKEPPPHDHMPGKDFERQDSLNESSYLYLGQWRTRSKKQEH
jgi:hypothetical protein